MKILIGADFVPTKTNEQYFIDGDMDYLFGAELSALMKKADACVFNLETPLADKKTPIIKCGPNFIAQTETVKLFKRANVRLFTLANNHIMDQGMPGYYSTIRILDQNGIAHLGCSDNLEKASEPYIMEVEKQRLGFYACVEHEFSVATEDIAGANPFNPLESFDHVMKLKKQSDYVVVLYHGGNEHYRYPSPYLQKNCRKFVEKGADLVICQHSHCIGCKETYKSGEIVYGQGNFLFDYSENVCWKTGILLQIEDGLIKYIPIVKEKNKVRLADHEISKKILNEFYERSQKIQNFEYVRNKYKEFSENKIDDYLWQISGAKKSKFLRVINKLSGYKFYKFYIKKRYRNEELLKILNYFKCEAHRESIINSLENKIFGEE